jgi:hypothetical protein
MQTLRNLLAVLTLVSGLLANNLLSPTTANSMERRNLINLESPELIDNNPCEFHYEIATQIYLDSIQGTSGMEAFDQVYESSGFRSKNCEVSKIKWDWVFLTIKSALGVCKLAIPLRDVEGDMVFQEEDFKKSLNHNNPNCMLLQPLKSKDPNPVYDDEDRVKTRQRKPQVVVHDDHIHNGDNVIRFKPHQINPSTRLGKLNLLDDDVIEYHGDHIHHNDHVHMIDEAELRSKYGIVAEDLKKGDKLVWHKDHWHHGDHTHKDEENAETKLKLKHLPTIYNLDEYLKATKDQKSKEQNNTDVLEDLEDEEDEEETDYGSADNKSYKLNMKLYNKKENSYEYKDVDESKQGYSLSNTIYQNPNKDAIMINAQNVHIYNNTNDCITRHGDKSISLNKIDVEGKSLEKL